ncbi:fibronectin type III domain-containing protein [Streptomyces sp. ASQP_92]|uniref:fibronectin type III domain-containing protein n=1 Tax=Streptomyces sp. ASQP_92 TaxID=2979116 RepID=UPI0021BF4E6A|nr:fibronectin type III domain-containing protein [Streptomyces sp. ASQP_92]MCT9092798.1 fibronectin type III domain-containing protein [Streptomyces sp. ASQP_92]
MRRRRTSRPAGALAPPRAPLAASLVALLLTACGGADDRDRHSPTVPAAVTAQASSATSVHVMWRPATDDRAVTGYEVLRDGTTAKTVPADLSMIDIGGLTASTSYRFTVRARDAAGNLSAPSAPAAVTTPAATPDDKRPPTAPQHLTGHADGTGAANLSWGRAVDDVGVTAYDVYQEGTRIHSVGGAGTSARLTGLRPGTVYTFTVRARDAADNASPDSDAVDVTTAAAPGAPPSTAPTRLRAGAARASSGGGTDITLRWVPPRTGGVIGAYQLFLDGAPTTTIVPGVPSPEGLTSYTFTVTDPPGTRYSVKLRARLPDGTWGDFSAQPTVVVP